MAKVWTVVSVAIVCLFATFGVSHASDGHAIVKAVNKIRVAHGLRKLRIEPRLQKAAIDQSRLMARKRKMAHTVGRGYDLGSRLKRVGYRGLAAENIARGQGSLQRVLKGWMNSPGHRRNMLHPRMRYFGLAVVKGGGRNYWAMVLGG